MSSVSETPTYNKKSPTIKRILREAAELASSPSPDYHASPLENNLFEWHFTLRGPPETPYANGIYHGRINLPPAYPMRPPSFRFLSPSGRFEVNREICLSISDFHEDTWQPAWGVRTAVVALRGFMETEPGGQVGALECSEEQRRVIADQSREWRCETCGQSSLEILKESEEAAKKSGADARIEEETPKELKIGFKVKKEDGEGSTGESHSAATAPIASESPAPLPTPPTEQPAQPPPPLPSQSQNAVAQQTPLFPHLDSHSAQQAYIRMPPEENFWLDRLIWAILFLLVAILLKRFIGLPGVY
ncbi:ubiquitin-conjugating enzyme/RWD-like protein [Sphaerosporella brunnea]|uniref:Ubiquitin-conjugating enzyme/RWD-like protein n=1 Tax=Sphaerosporella brunnea TaxID=1250544 RepID=A0A5J5ELL7_9PEZI|nr:ubiquitin-conjugating enzyme/RWD-like protein [Sphaerosporella brunnea]